MSLFHRDGRNSCFTEGCSFDVTSIHRARLSAGGKGKEERQAVFFTPLTCFFLGQSRRRIQQRRIKAEKSVLSWHMEASSGRFLLDPLSQGTRKGTAVFGRQALTPLMFTIQWWADCIEQVVSQGGDKT